MVALALVACGSNQPGPDEPGLVQPSERVVTIEATGCGVASARSGLGIAVGDDIVLTVAHLVARAGTIEVSVGGAPAQPAAIVDIDLDRDLAALAVPGLTEPPVAFAAIDEGGEGTVVLAPDLVPFEVRLVARLTTEAILGDERHSRVGYELGAATRTGDSGAGAYDDRGRLIGILFATEAAGDTAWVTASRELEDFLAGVDPDRAPIRCDPATSQLDVG